MPNLQGSVESRRGKVSWKYSNTMSQISSITLAFIETIWTYNIAAHSIMSRMKGEGEETADCLDRLESSPKSNIKIGDSISDNAADVHDAVKDDAKVRSATALASCHSNRIIMHLASS